MHLHWKRNTEYCSSRFSFLARDALICDLLKIFSNCRIHIVCFRLFNICINASADGCQNWVWRFPSSCFVNITSLCLHFIYICPPEPDCSYQKVAGRAVRGGWWVNVVWYSFKTHLSKRWLSSSNTSGKQSSATSISRVERSCILIGILIGNIRGDEIAPWPISRENRCLF